MSEGTSEPQPTEPQPGGGEGGGEGGEGGEEPSAPPSAEEKQQAYEADRQRLAEESQ